ncbi:hypothetical protein COC42_14690 [Sphingomonas spermidinifaciens]|uniref:Uncharacterized protein n=1 Tax=Sphingomonas spermidinifaciens TaxID=1141889 RepID=A0A2A4B4P5_9SPHN|nr:hypothetical protein [Sphingomonas spermidinifaciens]PCD02634.1 hypothetical protein COC42_14690 [Sphingomonas spermidinifaciens]
MSIRRLPAILLVLTAIGPATVSAAEDATITLLKPYEVATISGASLSALRFAALARLNPVKPSIAGVDAQTLSLFGREDIIAGASRDYLPNACGQLPGGDQPESEILRRARATSIVIINESHERSEHRGFTMRLLPGLREAGYTVLAMEALANPAPDQPASFQPSFVRDPGLSYLEDGDGFYLGEAGFGRLGRAARALGYTFLPYEERDPSDVNLSVAEQIARREEAQANSLAGWLRANPGRKLIVHVGYRHATEVPRLDSGRWMAARLKAKTGIDPLTVSQTTCRGGGRQARLAELPASEPQGAFDLVVDHPKARFVRGRPAWRFSAGDRPVTIPANLRPRQGWRVVEARPEGQNTASIPIDRVAIRPGEDIALMLPPGRYRLRVIDLHKDRR